MIEPGARNPGAGAGVGSFETRYVFELVVLVSLLDLLLRLSDAFKAYLGHSTVSIEI